MTAADALLVLALLGAALLPHFVLLRDERQLFASLQGGVAFLGSVLLALAPRLGIVVERTAIPAIVLAVSVILLGALVSRRVEPSATRVHQLLPLVALVIAVTFLQVRGAALDGDEPYYLLQTRSILQDGDLDLRNQYASIDSAELGRTALAAQEGDPVGPHGEAYSRHEPFLALLLLPGYAVAGREGAVLTIALMALLLARALWLLLEQEELDERGRIVAFLFVVCGPPLLFYSVRLWPELPAAWFLTEALRCVGRERRRSTVLWLVALSLLKLRFVLIAIPLLLMTWKSAHTRWRRVALVAVLAIAPMGIVWLVTGSALNVHSLSELSLQGPEWYWRGTFGLLLDGQHGMLFVAPALFFALVATVVGPELSRVVRIGLISASLYVFLLVPRAEWHGGWSPPMRYVVVFTPVLTLLLARALHRFLHPALVAATALWTAGVVVHGVSWPWRLFHIQNGESRWGEFLSARAGSDFSRLVPSFVRPNEAAVVATVALVLSLVVLWLLRNRTERIGASSATIFAVLFAAFLALGHRPGRVVDLEDSHVLHAGGELFPDYYRVARFAYTGGWRADSATVLQFRMKPGGARLHYQSLSGAVISLGARQVVLPATGPWFGSVAVDVPTASDRIVLTMKSGSAILDRIVHE